MMKSILLSTAALLCLNSISFTQEQPCGTDWINSRFGSQNPDKAAIRQQLLQIIDEEAMHAGAQRNTYVVPVVVHVLHKGGPENISNEQIEDAIRVLNEDLRRINSDTGNTRNVFKPHAADFNIEFRLAKKDPQGNCTNGITRTFCPISYEADDRVKDNFEGGIDAWPVDKYFNIWVVGRIQLETSGVIGYAYFPSWGMSGNYGVVMDNKYMGTIGTAQGRDGRTLTHEVGHCLELYHTFQSGCGNNCSNSGDRVCDTPPTADATYSCSFGLNSCSNDGVGSGSAFPSDVPDQVENYMSYNQNFCQNMFTKGQKQRSDASISNTFLAEVVSSANLISTGVADGLNLSACSLNPDFAWSKSQLCPGDSVLFSDLTQNGSPDSVTWNVQGPVSATYSGAPVFIPFPVPGIYSVTQTVYNSQGNQSMSKNAIIRVSGNPDFQSWMFYDNMDENPLTSSRWMSTNPGYGLGWQQKWIAPAQNNALLVSNAQTDANDIRYDLFSPVYDISGIDQPRLRFKTAFSAKPSGSGDNLKVWFSKDCGATWILRFTKTGSMLTSMPESWNAEEPVNGNDWIEWDINIPEFFQGSTQFSLRFAFTTGGGNDLYLDDINIMGVSALEEDQHTSIGLSPNPTDDLFSITFPENEGVSRIEIRDAGGRTIHSSEGEYSGMYTFSSIKLGLAPGCYFVSLYGAKETYMHKLVISGK
jgi:PKD repeat protein